MTDGDVQGLWQCNTDRPTGHLRCVPTREARGDEVVEHAGRQGRPPPPARGRPGSQPRRGRGRGPRQESVRELRRGGGMGAVRWTRA